MTAPAMRPVTVRFNPASGPDVSGHVVTIRDAGGNVVPGLDRMSAGGPRADSFTFRVAPGTYTATVEAVNLAPDPARPVYSDPAVSGPFTIAPPNIKPPAPFRVTVTDGA
jgi:hypothetical protein